MRTLALAALAAGAVALALLVRAPERKTGQAAVSGARLVRLPAHAIHRLELTLEDRHAVAERTASGWTLDGRPLPRGPVDPVQDLVGALAALRAVDQFRGELQVGFGLTPPRGTAVVTTAHREVRLSLGAFTATTATIYARRQGDHRIFQIGSYLLPQIERVLDVAERSRESSTQRQGEIH